MLSERIKNLSEKVRDTPSTICLDRARLITEFYRQPSMDPIILRRAKAFEYVLENKKIFIDEDSIIAGHMASRMHAVQLYPEVTAWLYDDLETIDTRKSDHFEFLPGEKDELREIVKEWKGNAFGDLTAGLVDEDMQEMIDGGIFTKGVSNLSTMNHAPDYPELLDKGYRYYIDKCKKKISELENMDIDTMESQITWESMIIAMEGIIKFAHRYAELADKMVSECDDDERKQQLLIVAENCRTVPENPPQNFQQAVQFIWFTHLAMMSEVIGHDHCIGRFDQYMYSFYKNDLERGFNEEHILDIVHELKLKVAEVWELRTDRESRAYPGCPLWIHIMLGGILPDGSDGCNELTNLILRGMEDLQTKEPCISFRYHSKVNIETFRLAIAVARKGGSHPAFFNDGANINDLLNLGFTLEEARDWGICGCIEPIVPGITDFQSNSGYFNPIKVLEITLNDGVDPIKNKQIGPRTGDVREFTSIEQIMEAYEVQQKFFINKFMVLFNRILSMHAMVMPTITGSCFTHGCIDKGRVLQRKGAHHRYSAIAISGVANVADSLAAIDKCVFRENYLSMAELMEMLSNNFKGNENIRQLLINRAPKYGNNLKEVDKYAHWLNELCSRQAGMHIDARGGEVTTVVSSQSYNVVLGRIVGATPDGRKAHEDLADNASPMIGMDVNGPTAALNSISFIDTLLAKSSVLVNQRFDPSIVEGEKGLDILETVISGFFKNNGQHIQLNVVDDDTLRAAQKDPKSYRNLLVRVAGYSAYFIDLEKDIQENIIARTLQKSV